MYMLVKINKGLKYMKNTQKQRGFDLNRITWLIYVMKN